MSTESTLDRIDRLYEFAYDAARAVKAGKMSFNGAMAAIYEDGRVKGWSRDHMQRDLRINAEWLRGIIATERMETCRRDSTSTSGAASRRTCSAS